MTIETLLDEIEKKISNIIPSCLPDGIDADFIALRAALQSVKVEAKDIESYGRQNKVTDIHIKNQSEKTIKAIKALLTSGGGR